MNPTLQDQIEFLAQIIREESDDAIDFLHSKISDEISEFTSLLLDSAKDLCNNLRFNESVRYFNELVKIYDLILSSKSLAFKIAQDNEKIT